jgi:hypothetical protein
MTPDRNLKTPVSGSRPEASPAMRGRPGGGISAGRPFDGPLAGACEVRAGRGAWAAFLLALALLAGPVGCSYVMQGTSQPVSFTSEPPGATFSVAGQSATTPVTLDLPKDDYHIAFHCGGYEDSSIELKRRISAWFYGSIAMGVIASTIDLASGAWKEFETTDVRVALRPLPDTVQDLPVTITSEPPGADIVIANRSYGAAPKDLRLPWPPGQKEQEVTFRLAGHYPKTLVLLRSEPRLDGVLEPMPVPVTIRITSNPPQAEVRVDGRLAGKTPLPLDLVWKKGEKPRQLELSLDGYRPEQRELTPRTQDLSIDLRETVEEIVLPLKIDPAGAKVVVDGVPVPDRAKEVRLAWSVSKTSHKITVSQPGYATKSIEVKRSAAAGPLEVRLAPSLPGNP